MAGAGGDAMARQVVAALTQHGQDVEAAALAELERVAQEAARQMRRLAPKWRSALTQSIRVDRPSDAVREIRPGVAYAEAVEMGRRPGKGAPFFGTPQAADLTAWLADHMPRGGGGGDRRGLARLLAGEDALRQRYVALSKHMKRHGVKAQPFVAPVAQEMETVLPQRVALAVRRAMAARGAGGGGGGGEVLA
jgi:hypothetical protein